MSFIKKIKTPSGTYEAVVESYRDGGKVKHRLIRWLGKEGEGTRRVPRSGLHASLLREVADVLEVDVGEALFGSIVAGWILLKTLNSGIVDPFRDATDFASRLDAYKNQACARAEESGEPSNFPRAFALLLNEESIQKKLRELK